MIVPLTWTELKSLKVKWRPGRKHPQDANGGLLNE